MNYQPGGTSCGANELLVWNAGLLRWECGSPFTLFNFNTGPEFGNSTIMPGSILQLVPGGIQPSHLNSSITNALWQQSGSDIYRGAGRVGVGTMFPEKSLQISDQTEATIRLRHGSPEKDVDIKNVNSDLIISKMSSAESNINLDAFSSSGPGFININRMVSSATQSGVKVFKGNGDTFTPEHSLGFTSIGYPSYVSLSPS
jgi:hypothetical protein